MIRKLCGVTAGAALLVTLILSPADTTDEDFLRALTSHGIVYNGPGSAVTAAHEVCASLDRGATPDQVAQAVIDDSTLDPFRAGFFVGASIAAYCPRGTG